MAHADEMVGPALFLASDAGSFVTGQVVLADGGLVPH
jgi:NAD(P)-dependent dehydrogenase (short-subunit alcohol dehydrogenase family)